MPIRPEAERKLRTGFERHVERQRERHRERLTHAAQLGARFECGDVIGLFTARVGGEVKRKAYVLGLLPIAAIPLLIVAPAVGIPGAVVVLGAWPFLTGAWFGACMWRVREPKRRVWLYAFADGFILLDDLGADPKPVAWSQVAEVNEVWTQVFNPSAEESRPALIAYRLRTADGQEHEIPLSLTNVLDPYGQIGRMLGAMAPAAVGQTIPTFPTIDEIITTYAPKS